jgi:hypothetical protein
MRFLADENVPRPIIERLRAEGHDVRAVIDDRAGAPDSGVLQAAALSGMILVTQDQVFGELVIQRQLPVADIERATSIASPGRMDWVMHCERAGCIEGRPSYRSRTAYHLTS